MNNKDKFGEVITPHHFIESMIHDCKTIMKNDFFEQIQSIFEPGSGSGHFFDILQNKNHLFNTNTFHYYLNEINTDHQSDLQQITENYKQNTSLIFQDILDLSFNQFPHLSQNIDLVIGNLPFNVFTKKFVPSLAINNKDNKQITNSKSITIWNKITQFCFDHLIKPNGFFFCIIPCIWLKPDKAHIYQLFTQIYTIHFLKIFNCVEANKIFKYNCQTPICYVLVQKKMNVHLNFSSFKLFDQRQNIFTQFKLYNNLCIPTKYSDMFTKSIIYNKQYGVDQSLSFIMKKISTLNPQVLNSSTHDYKKGGLEHHKLSDEEYKIITGASFDKKNNYLTLNGFVSKVPCLYYNKPKLILPHKRLPKFFKDYDGSYSCFGRDMYVFLCDSKEQIDNLYNFLTNEKILLMIQFGFTIRMNFIEKYVFDYFPNIFHKNFKQMNYLHFLS